MKTYRETIIDFSSNFNDAIKKREIKDITNLITDMAQQFNKTAREICFDLADHAGIVENNEKRKFYDCYRSCKAYHKGNTKKARAVKYKRQEVQ